MTDSSGKLLKIRSYNRVHMTAWALAIAKDGCVHCHFQNCKFISYDIDDIAEHYAYCVGGQPEGAFICDYCGCYMKNRLALLDHVVCQHQNVVDENIISELEAEEEEELERREEEGKRTISKPMHFAWEVYFDTLGFYRCFRHLCTYIASCQAEIEHHYINTCFVPMKGSLDVECLNCGGKTYSEEQLAQHLKVCHPKGGNLLTREKLLFWAKEFAVNGAALCVQPGCFYLQTQPALLKKHYLQCPKEPKEEEFEVCVACGCWFDDLAEHDKHWLTCHADSESKNGGEGKNKDKNCGMTIKKEWNTALGVLAKKMGSTGVDVTMELSNDDQLIATTMTSGASWITDSQADEMLIKDLDSLREAVSVNNGARNRAGPRRQSGRTSLC